jgi:glutamine synthetase
MGRDVPAIIVSQQDRRRYRDKVRRCLDVFARMLHDARFKEAPQQVGLEVEFYLVDTAGYASLRNAEVLAAISDEGWATELGKFNLEVNLAPRPLADVALAGLERDLAATPPKRRCRPTRATSCSTSRCARRGARRCGSPSRGQNA